MRPILIKIMLSSLLLSSALMAKSTDRNQAMDISADRTDAVLTDSGESALIGNVKISQGSLLIEADKALITRVNGDTSKITLSGSPAVLQQRNDNGELMKASANQMVYFISAQQMQLNGAVVIDQPRGSMRGESIKYDMKTGRLDGGGDGTRVQMRLNAKPGTP